LNLIKRLIIMGYFDDLNNPDWGESTAAAKIV
jgi:hypothetical protein